MNRKDEVLPIFRVDRKSEWAKKQEKRKQNAANSGVVAAPRKKDGRDYKEEYRLKKMKEEIKAQLVN